MPDEKASEKTEIQSSASAPFGPSFFLGQLRAFARDSCPNPSEALPSVAVHLATGEALELCHVIGLAPAFVALAVIDEAKGAGRGREMRTEIVPYGLITRVTITSRRERGTHVGFDSGHVPRVFARSASPEEALRAAADAPPGSDDASPGASGAEPT